MDNIEEWRLLVCYGYGTLWYRRTLRRNTKALSSSETSVLTRATRRNIPEDATLHSHRRENLKSYIALIGWNL
jgi:hypothetical protein